MYSWTNNPLSSLILRVCCQGLKNLFSWKTEIQFLKNWNSRNLLNYDTWLVSYKNKKRATSDGIWEDRSGQEVFCRKGVLKNFCKIYRKTPTVPECLRPATLLKKRVWHRCFPVNFTKFLGTPIFIENLWWLFLKKNNSLVSISIPHPFPRAGNMMSNIFWTAWIMYWCFLECDQDALQGLDNPLLRHTEM